MTIGIRVLSLACAVLFAATCSASAGAPRAAVSPPLRKALSARPGAAQRVWVFFTDKRLQTQEKRRAALAESERELSARAVRRRQLRRSAPGVVDERDVAVSGDYLAAVSNTGARLRHASRWLNAISVEATGEQVAAISQLAFVRRIQLVATARRKLPAPRPPAGGVGPRGDPGFYGFSYDQLLQINVTGAHDGGYDGTGVVVGILDTGFNRTHEAFNQTTGGAHPVQVIDEYDFVDDDPIASQEAGDPDGQADHGTYILGTLGSYYPTVLVGSVYNASFLLAKTENVPVEIPSEEDDYVAGLEWLELNGADMATSSLGYIDWYSQSDLDGQTAVTTIAVNTATDNGMPCCTAAGNEGNDSDPFTSHLIAPADALRVLSCGAVDPDGILAFFSSDGPTADGRVKPEVLARGYYTNTVAASDNTSYVGVAGTSLSTPLVAGAVALIVQAHPDWSVDKIRRALFHTADDFLAGATYDPLYGRGYGIINTGEAIGFVHSDIDGDGSADGNDVSLFSSALLGSNGDFDQTRRADVDASGAVEPADTVIFVNDLLGN